MPAEPAEPGTALVLWDVDHTLIENGGVPHRTLKQKHRDEHGTCGGSALQSSPLRYARRTRSLKSVTGCRMQRSSMS